MVICLLLYIFFFSSRRRHTRSLCDWSSDVCSSDLGAYRKEYIVHMKAREIYYIYMRSTDFTPYLRLESGNGQQPVTQKGANAQIVFSRSEERRVGKECKTRSASHK